MQRQPLQPNARDACYTKYLGDLLGQIWAATEALTSSPPPLLLPLQRGTLQPHDQPDLNFNVVRTLPAYPNIYGGILHHLTRSALDTSVKTLTHPRIHSRDVLLDQVVADNQVERKVVHPCRQEDAGIAEQLDDSVKRAHLSIHTQHIIAVEEVHPWGIHDRKRLRTRGVRAGGGGVQAHSFSC